MFIENHYRTSISGFLISHSIFEISNDWLQIMCRENYMQSWKYAAHLIKFLKNILMACKCFLFLCLFLLKNNFLLYPFFLSLDYPCDFFILN
jgi:hypothetical protein